MKNILKLIILFLIISTTRVFAFEEYCVSIDSGIAVQNCVSGDTISDYSSILTFENGVLTLFEGLHYNDIHSHNNITVTSNGKLVYLNYLSVESNDLIINNVNYESYNSNVTNATLDITTHLPEYTHIGGNSLKIIDSNIRLISEKSPIDNRIHSNSSNVEIDNSNIYTKYYIDSVTGSISVKDSNIITGGLFAYNDNSVLNINNSEIQFEHNQQIMQSGIVVKDINITKSKLEAADMIEGNSLNLTNSSIIHNKEKDSVSCVYIFQNTDIKNSTLDIYSSLITQTLSLNNSSVSINTTTNALMVSELGYDYSTASSFIVNSEFIFDDSYIEVHTDRSVPAVALNCNITSNIDNLVFIDDNKNIFDFKKVNASDYGFLANPNNYSQNFNYIFINSIGLTEAYTLLKDDEATFNFRSSTVVKYKLKIVNGTWEDGTDEDKEINLFDGNLPDKNTIKSTSKVKGYGLTITKTGNNEYTYEYKEIKNPKTGVYSLSVLYVVFFISFIVFRKINKNTSLFKSI